MQLGISASECARVRGQPRHVPTGAGLALRVPEGRKSQSAHSRRVKPRIR